MRIDVAAAIGYGPTTLSAFDAALCAAGVADRNLIRLSSVIPPHAELVVHNERIAPEQVRGQWGDELHVVYAEMRVDTHNTEAWAGIGWVRDPDGGRGLFVEHEGESEQKVRLDIEQSLSALMVNRGVKWPAPESRVIGVTCVDDPVCALVIAAYQNGASLS